MRYEIKLTSQELKPVIEITALNSAYVYNFHKDFKGPAECHAPIELIYVDKGSQIVYEGNDKYTLNKGEAFLHRSLKVHKDETNGTFTNVYIMSFTCDSTPLETLFDKIITFNNQNIYALKEIFDLIKREKFETKSTMFYFGNMKGTISKDLLFGNANRIKNKLELLFLDLLEQEANASTKTETKYSKATDLLIKELKAHISNKLELDEISKKLFYTKSYLCRKFKEDTGITIVQYFYEMKINEAKLLMLNTTKSLQEISDNLSFESVQYFNYIFKKYVGMSPKQWQKSIAKSRFYF